MALFDNDIQSSKKLLEDFIVPPFSTLDTRLQYWQDRKRMWLNMLDDLTETRNEDGKTFNMEKASYKGRQTSTFDPVLAELMYKWFCLPGGRVLDVFGGEQTKGFVAGKLGLEYLGIEIRKEQVDVCKNKTEEFYPKVDYMCDDSSYALRKLLVDNHRFDFLFTSPPYYNLEVYSDSDLSSSQSYVDFMNCLYRIFCLAYDCMNNDTFFCIKVGEIRDKSGKYLGFVPDTIKMLQGIGWQYYNEIILINQSGSACLRAAGNMKSRKVVKTHQNVLVFYKGNIANIKNKFERLR